MCISATNLIILTRLKLYLNLTKPGWWQISCHSSIVCNFESFHNHKRLRVEQAAGWCHSAASSLSWGCTVQHCAAWTKALEWIINHFAACSPPSTHSCKMDCRLKRPQMSELRVQIEFSILGSFLVLKQSRYLLNYFAEGEGHWLCLFFELHTNRITLWSIELLRVL